MVSMCPVPHRHPSRWHNAGMAFRDPELTSAVSALRKDRVNGRDALDIAAVWSTHLRDRIDTSLAATGSTGRGEATPRSDLDVIGLSPGGTPSFHRLLASGVRGDKHGVGPGGTALPDTEIQWREKSEQWLQQPGADLAVVKLGLLADADAPVHRIASEGFAGSPMLADMLRDALSTTPPRVAGPLSKNSVALKDELFTPVVKIARWAALASGSPELSTVARLATSHPRFLDQDDASALADVHRMVMELRVDLDMGVGNTRVFERRDRIMVPALPKTTAASLRSSVTGLRRIMKKLTYLLSASEFTVDGARGNS